jgi:hypothetical protein
MTTENPFEYATRNKLRFASVRGDLTVENLWDVPLRTTGSGDGFNLNAIAKTVSASLKETEENFVEDKKTTTRVRLEVALDIVKYIIATKLNDEALAKRRVEAKAEKEKLLEILAEKQAGKLSALSESEIKKRIAALE